MSNNSIFGKKWIDIVFEGRNKAYGAYKLRQENGRTTGLAFFFGIGSFGVLALGFSLFSSFKPVPTPEPTVCPINDTLILVNYRIEPPKPAGPIIKPKQTEPVETAEVKPKDLVNPTIVTRQDNPDDINTNVEAAKPKPVENGDPNGVEMKNPTEGGGGEGKPGSDGPGTENPDANGPVLSTLLDTKPMFPGGMEQFYKKVKNEFNLPEMDAISGQVVRVNVQFVIEKDGSVSDVKALNNPGYGMDREAVRVLRNMKVKWTPGILKGQKVRTIYVLPISVRMP